MLLITIALLLGVAGVVLVLGIFVLAITAACGERLAHSKEICTDRNRDGQQPGTHMELHRMQGAILIER